MAQSDPTESVDNYEPEYFREERPEPYVGVGASLQQARLSAGEDLQHVANVLRIRRAHLEAIEKGLFDQLPAKVYAVAFIRSYSDHLNLDSDWVVDRFREEIDPQVEDQDVDFKDASPQLWRPGLIVLGAAGALAAIAYGGWAFFLNRGDPAPQVVEEVPDHLLGAAVPQRIAAQPEDSVEPDVSQEVPRRLAISDTAAAASTANSAAALAAPASPTDTANAPPAASTSAPTTEEPAAGTTPGIIETAALAPAPPAETAADTAEEAPANAAPPARQGSRVVLRARTDTWVRVRNPTNDETLYVQTMRKGDIYNVPNIPGLVLRTGNAGGLEIVVDGEPLDTALGRMGQVRNLPLDPEALLVTAQ